MFEVCPHLYQIELNILTGSIKLMSAVFQISSIHKTSVFRKRFEKIPTKISLPPLSVSTVVIPQLKYEAACNAYRSMTIPSVDNPNRYGDTSDCIKRQ